MATHPQLTPLEAADLVRLHRRAIEDPDRIAALLRRASHEGVRLFNGISRRNEQRVARIVDVDGGEFVVESATLDESGKPQLFFSFSLDGREYFFAAAPLERRALRLGLRLPVSIYEAERRDTQRLAPGSATGVPSGVELLPIGGPPVRGRVHDCSYHGLCVAVPARLAPTGESVDIRFLDGERAGQTTRARLRHTCEPDKSGWTRLGFSVSQVVSEAQVEFESRSTILGESSLRAKWRRVGLARSGVLAAGRRGLQRLLSPGPLLRVETVRFKNDLGQAMVGVVNSVDHEPGAPAILIPPAWGKTKETLLPLALTLVSSFARAGKRVTVLRFDGTQRRGESYIDPENRRPGSEYLGFRFSHAVRDIQAAASLLHDDPRFRAPGVVLVTFSLASIEGRRALAIDEGLFKGWISVVGMVDLQSGLKAVSGGVDYAYGLRRGIQFGRHELVGVVADMDSTGRDALDNKLVFAEDARQDMAQIEVPVTWLHGRDDAWIDLERVKELLSAGSGRSRRLIHVPTGHRLRNSSEAIETFGLVAVESARMLGFAIEARRPRLSAMDEAQQAERARLTPHEPDLVAFWEDYLLGADRRLGFDLITATAAYQELMNAQIAGLEIRNGMRIADLGSGTGAFCRFLLRREGLVDVAVVEVDLVVEGLKRGRSNRPDGFVQCVRAQQIGANFSDQSLASVPLADGSCDRVLASLLLGYVRDTKAFLREVRRILRPGGKFVVSSLRRDADMSRVYVEGTQELTAVGAERVFGRYGQAFPELQRLFLNQAAKIFDLEESGTFRFFDGEELVETLREAGFRRTRRIDAFGDPPQANVLVASLDD